MSAFPLPNGTHNTPFERDPPSPYPSKVPNPAVTAILNLPSDNAMLPELPPLHSQFLEKIHTAVAVDPRLTALLAAGSYIHGGFDVTTQ